MEQWVVQVHNGLGRQGKLQHHPTNQAHLKGAVRDVFKY